MTYGIFEQRRPSVTIYTRLILQLWITCWIKAKHRAAACLALAISRLRVTDDLRFVTDGLRNHPAKPGKQARSVTDDLENRDL